MNLLFTRICCLFVTALPICSMAEPNPLIGTWQSDHEKTMDFIRKNTKITGKLYELGDQIFGKMKIAFTEDQTCTWMPEWQFDGKTMPGWENIQWESYTVVDVNKDWVITSAYDPQKGKPYFARYDFDGPDTMWMDPGDGGMIPLHAREYFKRIPTPAMIPCKTSDAEPDMDSNTHPEQK